ncbi:MAG: hypothetical protein P1T08_14915 [Acidimicrobiia bacterium]|nr:hypothetical protein [Acidimicrobiia bacterium]
MGGNSPGRLAAAIGLIVVLAAVLVWQVFDWSSEEPAGSDAVTIGTPVPVLVFDEEVWIAAAQDALDAWARFASTGDLAVLDGFLDPAGPQYAQLFGEASTIGSDEATYSFTLVEPTAAMRDGFPVVSGTVIIARDGETVDEVVWDLHLIEGGTRWLLWTVEDRG